MTISRSFQPRLVIMLKEPRPGRVKTRLGRDIGMTSAAWWFRHQTRNLIRRLQGPGWQTILAVSPDREGLHSRIWPQHLARWPQGHGNLGDRMAAVFGGMPKGPVVIVGADIPQILPRHIRSAFRALGSSDAVIGPATDGGYWLIGLKRIRPPGTNLFNNVRWSGEHALSDTLATLASRKVAFIDTLADVDRAADLQAGFPRDACTAT